MTSVTNDHILTYLDDVTKAVDPVYPRYRKWVERDDLIQEALCWIVAREDKARDLKKKSPWYLQRRLRTVADRYGRRQKAIMSGYEPADEYFYSLPELLRMLPEALDSTATPPKPQLQQGTAATGTVDMAEWATRVADLRRALQAVAYPHFRVLNVYNTGTPVNPDDVRKALVAVQRKLGGRKPRG